MHEELAHRFIPRSYIDCYSRVDIQSRGIGERICAEEVLRMEGPVKRDIERHVDEVERVRGTGTGTPINMLCTSSCFKETLLLHSVVDFDSRSPS